MYTMHTMYAAAPSNYAKMEELTMKFIHTMEHGLVNAALVASLKYTKVEGQQRVVLLDAKGNRLGVSYESYLDLDTPMGVVSALPGVILVQYSDCDYEETGALMFVESMVIAYEIWESGVRPVTFTGAVKNGNIAYKLADGRVLLVMVDEYDGEAPVNSFNDIEAYKAWALEQYKADLEQRKTLRSV